MMSRNTRAGIDCIKVSDWSTTKVLGGIIANRYLARVGGTSGWFTKPNMLALRDEVESVKPVSNDRWRKDYTGQEAEKGFGHWLAHRSRRCWPVGVNGGLDELQHFRQPGLSAIYAMAKTHLENGVAIEAFHRYQAQEAIVRAAFTGTPGMYLRQSPDAACSIYVGSGGDVDSRSDGHKNSDLKLVQAWATDTKGAAEDLESATQRLIEQSGLVVGTNGGKGYYRLRHDVDGLEMVSKIVTEHFREFTRGTVGFIK